MGAINALVPRQRSFDGIPTSVPFTYRDGLTTLQLIECLRHNLDISQRELGKVEEAMADLATSTDKALADSVARIDRSMAALRAELLSLVHEMEQQGAATSPVYGVTQPLGQVLGGMYDNARIHGLFSGDYDDMGLTAREYDGLALGAREYDLRATDVDNCVPGDFPGRSRFPYGGSMPEDPPADMSSVTRSEADARHVGHDPTAGGSDGGERTTAASDHTENHDPSQFVGKGA